MDATAGPSNPKRALLTECPICLERYNQTTNVPKQLPECQHSLCMRCASHMIVVKVNGSVLKCPTCRKMSVVARGTPESLPTNIYIMEFLDSVTMLCGQPTVTEEETCAKHKGQPLFFFCRTCQVPACQSCTVVIHDKMKEHQIVEISEVRSEYVNKIDHRIQEVDMWSIKVNSKIEQLRNKNRYTVSAEEDSLVEIEDYFTKLASEVSEKIKYCAEQAKKQLKDSYSKQRSDALLQRMALSGIQDELTKKKMTLDATKSFPVPDLIKITATASLSVMDQENQVAVDETDCSLHLFKFKLHHTAEDITRMVLDQFQSLDHYTYKQELPLKIELISPTPMVIQDLVTIDDEDDAPRIQATVGETTLIRFTVKGADSALLNSGANTDPTNALPAGYLNIHTTFPQAVWDARRIENGIEEIEIMPTEYDIGESKVRVYFGDRVKIGDITVVVAPTSKKSTRPAKFTLGGNDRKRRRSELVHVE